MSLAIPPRLVELDGRLDNSHTVRGTYISSRSGLAYCEMAVGTSGKQTAWRPAALYCPKQSDPAHYPAGRGYQGERWFLVGCITDRASHRGFKMEAHRSFNPSPSRQTALIYHSSQSDLRVLMEHILEKWYG